jgi:predicted DsbA family dithiol-disulfide isomerase
MIYILSCVVHKFFLTAGVVHQHFHFALFRPDNNRLAAHTADHIKGIHRAAAQGQFQNVFLNALFQRLFQVVGNLEESVGRA